MTQTLSTRTVCCKLSLDADAASAIWATATAFNAAATYSAQVAWRERITNPAYKNGIYARTVTVSDLINDFAPTSDDNDEAAYVASIERDVLTRGGGPKERPVSEEKRTPGWIARQLSRHWLTKARHASSGRKRPGTATRPLSSTEWRYSPVNTWASVLRLPWIVPGRIRETAPPPHRAVVADRSIGRAHPSSPLCATWRHLAAS